MQELGDNNEEQDEICSRTVDYTEKLENSLPTESATNNEDADTAETSSRMWASSMFVAILVVIGLPLWWKTTEVYRVSLPYSRIENLNHLPFRITTNLTLLTIDDDAQDMIRASLLKEFRDDPNINVNIKTESYDGKLDVNKLVSRSNHVYVVQTRDTKAPVLVDNDRVIYFSCPYAASPVLPKVLRQWVYQTAALEGARAARGGDPSRRTRLPSSAEYHVTLSVLQPSPQTMKVELDAQDALVSYIGAFVQDLRSLHKFTLKSQWLHFLELDFKPARIEDDSPWGRHFAVSEDRLPSQLTPVEKRTATHVSEQPTVNLVLYPVPCDQAPLRIYDKHGRKLEAENPGFMSARWGGVVIANPSFEECRQQLQGAETSATYVPPLNRVMGTFVAQLRPLLGLQTLRAIDGAVLGETSPRAREWEVDALARTRVVEHLTSAKLSLQSLAELLGRISNIVINDEVGGSIYSAVDAIEQAARQLAAGDVEAAYALSQRAFAAAESAFVDPSLLALLYFPDDQKYAVYIPLFLPVMIPVLFSLRGLVEWLRSKPAKLKID